MPTSRDRRRGFTLIEIAIALSLLALLAAVALPAYRQTALKSRRSEAWSALAQLQLQEERWRVLNPQYANATELGLPASLPSAHYAWSVPVATAASYTLRATAIDTSPQHQDQQGGDSCRVLEVDQSGQRSPAACWR